MRELPVWFAVVFMVTAFEIDYGNAYIYSKSAVPRSPGTVVPQPKSIKTEKTYYTVSESDFGIENKLPEKCDIVVRAIDRYFKNGLIFDDKSRSIPNHPEKNVKKRGKLSADCAGKLKKLIVVSSNAKFSCENVPSDNMDESYQIYTQNLNKKNQELANNELLDTNQEFVEFLAANTSWGIIRGLETFSQLVYSININNNKMFAFNETEIYDKPRFSFRGLMIDTARHYIPVKMILKNLDAMAYNKFNVFHWHMIDDQSFPFVSKQFKNLSEFGAFTPSMVYTHEDIKNIIDYANDRGIRVLPEFDTPGHTYGMRFIPKLLTQCFDVQNKPNGDFGPVDPTRIESYIFLRKLLSEITQLFNDNHFHAGGDEVDMSCWRSNEEIRNWMKNHSMTSYVDLNSYYMDRLLNMINYHNRTPIVWQEVFDTGAPMSPNTVVHIWKYMSDPAGYYSELDAVTKAGYQALFSSCWYLNLISYGQDWVKSYECDPHNFAGSQTQFDLIRGGEACMWSEFVDETNLTPRLWPRASAVAERLWSPREVNDVEKFMPRLEQFRCRLRNRDIAAEPVVGPGYCPGT